MKIYTKTGDDGTTGLLGAGRVLKSDPRINAYGTVDELNAVLGVARSAPTDPEIDALLERIQIDLFAVGAALADPDPEGPFHRAVTADQVAEVERRIDAFESELPALNRFILPGGTPSAAALHLARTVCRRAERQVVELGRTPGEHVPDLLVIYLNRLSDALFVVARVANLRAGVPDVPWEGP